MASPKNDFNEDLVQGNTKDATKAYDAKSRDLWMVERQHIKMLPGFNVRQETPEYLAHVAAIAASILTEGYFQSKPLEGYVRREGESNVIYVTDGHTRLRAWDLAVSQGFQGDRLPMVMRPSGTTLEDLTVGLVKSNNGAPLQPYEVGLVCKRLVGYGMDVAQVSTRLSLSPKYVEDLLSLVGAPQAIRAMVAAGQVSATQAITTLKKDGDKAVSKLQEGLKTAKAAGKKKVTARMIPAAKDDAFPIKAHRGGGVTVKLSETLTVALERVLSEPEKTPSAGDIATLGKLRAALSAHLKTEEGF